MWKYYNIYLVTVTKCLVFMEDDLKALMKSHPLLINLLTREFYWIILLKKLYKTRSSGRFAHIWNNIFNFGFRPKTFSGALWEKFELYRLSPLGLYLDIQAEMPKDREAKFEYRDNLRCFHLGNKIIFITTVVWHFY